MQLRNNQKKRRSFFTLHIEFCMTLAYFHTHQHGLCSTAVCWLALWMGKGKGKALRKEGAGEKRQRKLRIPCSETLCDQLQMRDWNWSYKRVFLPLLPCLQCYLSRKGQDLIKALTGLESFKWAPLSLTEVLPICRLESPTSDRFRALPRLWLLVS